MHFCDIHAPFQHHAALELAYQLAEYVQPEIIVVGSDAVDFSLLSSFAHDPELVEETSDELDGFETFWKPHSRELRQRCPGSLLVYIWGNHEARIKRYIEKQAPKLRKRVLRQFIEIVRCGGDVLYLGEVDRVRIGPLLVMHGNRVGQHPAYAVMKDLGFQVSAMMGHNHKLDSWVTRGEDYQVVGAVSGCLCNYPHYVKVVGMTQKWQLGTAIAEVDLQGREVTIHNLLFNKDNQRVWTRFERRVFQSPLVKGDVA